MEVQELAGLLLERIEARRALPPRPRSKPDLVEPVALRWNPPHLHEWDCYALMTDADYCGPRPSPGCSLGLGEP